MRHVAPSGSSASPDFTAPQLARNMPSGFPTSSPKKTPIPTDPISGDIWKILRYSSDVISTPAFASAKIGITRKVTEGASACSSR